MSARMVIGDVFDCLAATPDGSVDLILTSPPFLALRSYLPADHPDKAKEIGSEPDPGAFIDTLLALSAEWRRVLAPHGSIAVELGDSYSDGDENWPEAKSLALVPESYRVALAYGRNPITGTESPAGRWKVRNVVRWCRPNPPVGALGDKFRPGTSDMVIACTSGTRYFDLDAVRTAHKTSQSPNKVQTDSGGSRNDDGKAFYTTEHPAGAPPLDWWQVSTEGFSGSHYATWPRKLLTRPILAMCPQRVCTVCGEPSRRLQIENPDYEGRAGGPLHENARQGASLKGFSHKRYSPTKFLPGGWTDCGCDGGDQRWRNGIVLDPFAGSGTTLMVATGHGRDAVGFDLDERNAALAMERVGMFLTVDHLERAS